MRRYTFVVTLLSTTLGGCSYGYGVEAVAGRRGIMFVVDPNSPETPSCVRLIEVYSVRDKVIVWRDSVDYQDDCANDFPVTFGERFKGRHEPDWPVIPARPLRRGVPYEVRTTTGAIGYGLGHFMIRDNGRIENMPISNSSAEPKPSSDMNI
ncbi:hypothetical protein [Sphingomonas sp. PB1R3]|uniref:hypothetical protein n=1 Tax=Sphingomonas flavida TaxID=3096154 RepID=UPI002FC86E90